MMKYIITIIVACVGIIACGCNKEDFNTTTGKNENKRNLAKYEPRNGECFIFAGQDLGAVGGMEEYNEGYCDYFKTPAGVTAYIGFMGAGGIYGMFGISNWGSGDCSLNKYTTVSRFDNCMFAIGLPITSKETDIVKGTYDKAIKALAKWLKEVSPRPVFLRIGYEFDGYDWNHYKPATYVPAYRYIKDMLDSEGVENVAYVWQSKGYGCSLAKMEEFYPGDEYVDWCGYSYFDQSDTLMLDFARLKKKPVFIAESTPTTQDGNWKYDNCYLTDEDDARRLHDEWFEVLLDLIEENEDVIKAWHYINVDWYAQELWKTNITFQKVDSRIHVSELISGWWTDNVINNDRFIQSEDLDWTKLP